MNKDIIIDFLCCQINFVYMYLWCNNDKSCIF